MDYAKQSEDEQSIEIWDSNGLNPYGQEVADVLRNGGKRVRIWLPRTTKVILRDRNGLSVKAVLASSPSLDGTLSHVRRRLVGPIRFLLSARRKRRIILLLWTRGPLENLVFSIAAKAIPIYVVHHNPRKERDGDRSSRWSFDQLLRRSTRVLVHSQIYVEDLRTKLRRQGSRRCAHPPYADWVSAFPRRPESRVPTDARTRVLLLGALRSDKGVEHLASIALALDPHRHELTIVGTGVVPSALRERDGLQDLRICLNVGSGPVPDCDIADALQSSDVLLAPYVAATVSGTVILAATAGLPVLGYKGGALAEYLTPEALTETASAEALVGLLDVWASSRFETFRQSPIEMREPCRRHLD